MFPRSQSLSDLAKGHDQAFHDLALNSPNITPIKERIIFKVASTSKMITNILSKMKVENPDPKIPKTALVKNTNYFPSDFFSSNNNHRQLNIQLKKKPPINLSSSNRKLNLPLDLKKSSFCPFVTRGSLPTPKFSSDHQHPLITEGIVKPSRLVFDDARDPLVDESPAVSPIIEKKEPLEENKGNLEQNFSNQCLMTFLPGEAAHKLSPVKGPVKRSTSVPKLVIFKKEPALIPVSSAQMSQMDAKGENNSICNTSTTTGTPLTQRDSVENLKKMPVGSPIFREVSKLSDFQALKPIKKILKHTNSVIIAQGDQSSSQQGTPQVEKKKKITIKINRSQPVIAQDSISSLNLRNLKPETATDGCISERDLSKRSRTEHNILAERQENSNQVEETPSKTSTKLPSIFQNLLKTRSGSRMKSVGDDEFNVRNNHIPDIRTVESRHNLYVTPTKSRGALSQEPVRNSSHGKAGQSMEKRNNSIDQSNVSNSRQSSIGKLQLYNMKSLYNSVSKHQDELNFSFNKENELEERNNRKDSFDLRERGKSEDHGRYMDSVEKERHMNRFASLLDSSNSKTSHKRRIMINQKLQNKFF